MPAHAPSTLQRRGFLRLWNAPYLLLVLTMLFWSGNFVLGRAVAEAVPPVALAFWRWFGGFLILLGFAWPHLRRDWPEILRCWRMMLLLSAVGVATFNTLVYIGLGSTTAINALLLQSTMPVVIILFSFLLFRDRIGLMQALGLAASLAGVAAIVGRGEPAALLALSFNEGDLLIFTAVVSYALYSALLRRRPAIHPLSFLAASFALGAAMLLPFHLWEHLAGNSLRANATTFLAIFYVAVFPSILAYLCFNRGVELIGANRAGQFVHLMPLFGSLLAIAFLGERFRLYHALGMALIGAGILLATRASTR